MKPTADEIRENSPVDCSITSGESLRVDQKQKAGFCLFFFVFKKGRETRFRILKPTADKIRENSILVIVGNAVLGIPLLFFSINQKLFK